MKLFANLMNIKSSKIGQYPGDTEGNSIILTSEGSAGKGETSQQYGMAGFISNPATNVKGIRFRIGSLDIVIGALSYKVSLPENPGETKVYSTDADGNEKSTIKLKDDGTIEINGNTDNAVSHADLTLALNNFTTALNIALAAKLDGGGSSPGLSIDISGAKVDTVKLP